MLLSTFKITLLLVLVWVTGRLHQFPMERTIKGYTVPYHAHNDFIHVFAEVGILGGLAYLSLFCYLTFFLFRFCIVQRKEDGNTDFSFFLLVLPFIIYGIDAGLNFPVARPLMQSALALYMGLLLSIYLNRFTSKEAKPVSPLYY